MGNVFYFGWEEQYLIWLQHLGESGILHTILLALNNFFSMLGEETICVAVMGLVYWGISKEKGRRIGIVVIAAIIGVYFLWNGKVMAAYEKQDKPIYSEELVKYAESGDAVAQCDLGVCYANGSGIAKDSYEAFKWFKLSAEQGDARGMRELGTCYVEGLGVEKNEEEGIKLYKLSAEKGNEDAMYYLGACFYNGVGVSQDYGEAVKWWKKAAEKGHDGAKEALRNMDY